ncbi:hypothetical protein [Ilumatobacter sp.]|uniref:hypothetical protein n=1 Tax=Ilumatobacter sp. TaxID=1967498 RepID=UPI003AF6CDD8
MPYTLMKGLAWILLAVVLGIVIGWLLRSVAAKRQIERAKRTRVDTDDQAELERLQARVANLEPVVNERDRLRAELEQSRTSLAEVPDLDSEPSEAPAVAAPRADVAASPEPPRTTIAPEAEAASIDVSGAQAALGKRITPDDLTVIEGIGPKIADLCHGIGIRTWAELADTEVSLLRTMLNDAGQRFKAHDPSSWPEQAGLLATGAWSEFVALTDRLDGGRPAD